MKVEEPMQIQIQNADSDKPSIKDAYENIAGDLEYILKMSEITAKITRKNYLDFIHQGFSKEESLFLADPKRR